MKPTFSSISWCQKINQNNTTDSILKNVRIHGTILAMEVETGEADGYLHSIRDDIYQYFLKEGILMRPLGNTIYILAPYCIEDEDLAYIYGKIMAFAQGLI